MVTHILTNLKGNTTSIQSRQSGPTLVPGVFFHQFFFLSLIGMYSDDLKNKAGELWETIVRLETEKYDLQERQKRQDYDVSSILSL